MGFVWGESNFFITIDVKSRNERGSEKLSFSLCFSISQYSRDDLLLRLLIDYFGCGYVSNYKPRDITEFIVTKLDDITEHIIPFFEIYPLKGSKLNILVF